MDKDSPMRISVTRNFGSLTEFTWEPVPPFAIITGVNGAGKSQFLEVVARRYGAYREEEPGRTRRRLSDASPVEILGSDFRPGDVFYSGGNWPTIRDTPVTDEALRGHVAGLRGGDSTPWLWEALSARRGMDVSTLQRMDNKDLFPLLTPQLLWGMAFPASDPGLSFLIYTYIVLTREARELDNRSETDIRELYGDPPWETLNTILSEASIPFRLDEPHIEFKSRLMSPQSFQLTLRDTERDRVVKFEDLSSGEKVIMSTVRWLYGAQTTGKQFQFLLLDEPDAHLHPSLTRHFLNVLQKVFVEQRNVRVIMTTHSPSTVALAPEDSLFEMRRSGEPRIVKVRSKAEAIASLTDGFLVTERETRTVMVEGKTDVPFYSMLWELLTHPASPSGRQRLKAVPGLHFVQGKCKDVVETIVPELHAHGFTRFRGIVDRDTGADRPPQGVKALARNAFESYLWDPLNVYAVLHEQNQAPAIANIDIPAGKIYLLAQVKEKELQLVVDTVCAAVRVNLTPMLTSEELKAQNVSLLGGRVLAYPAWWLYLDEQILTNAVRKTFGQHLVTEQKLLKCYRTIDLIPEDLFQLLRSMQEPMH